MAAKSELGKSLTKLIESAEKIVEAGKELKGTLKRLEEKIKQDPK